MSEPGPGSRTWAAVRRVPRRVVLLHLAVFGLMVVASVLLWWHVWITGHPTTTITCQCGDPSQELWFLSWTPWALVHGHNPMLTNAMFTGQGGANMITNTSWMVPSIVLAPVTWLFGPIAAFNVAATLGPAVTGWSAFVAARRLTTFVPGQVLAGVLYGFCPFVLWNDPVGHLNFTLLYFAPLAFVLVYDLAVGTHRATVLGALLGALVVVQFFTSTEFLAMCVLVGVVGGIAAVAMSPRMAWELRRRLVTGLGMAALIDVVVLAYPVWFAIAGPRHVTGVPWPNAPQLGLTPSAPIDAGVNVHAGSVFDRLGGYFGGGGPNFGPTHFPSLIYLGAPLLVLLVLSAIRWAKAAWTIAIMGAAAWLLSFGTMAGTEFAGRAAQTTPWWAVWRLFAHLPLVEDIEPIRFGALVTWAAALLLAVSLDIWVGMAAARQDRRARTISAVLATLVGVAVLVPVALVESVPFTVHSTPLPAWFVEDAPKLPAGTTVLVVPFAGQQAMGWQAQTRLHFDLAGGFAVVPGPTGRSRFVVPVGGAVGVLDRLSPGPDTLAPGPEPSTPAEVAEVRAAIVSWGVDVTVIPDGQSTAPVGAAAFMTAVYGRTPMFAHGAWVWTGVPSAPVALGATTLADCVALDGSGRGGPLAGPGCVLAGGPVGVPVGGPAGGHAVGSP